MKRSENKHIIKADEYAWCDIIMMLTNRNLQRKNEMKDFSKATKIGLIIMIIAGLVMALLVIVGESVPDLVAWMFFVGLVISIASTLFVKKR